MTLKVLHIGLSLLFRVVPTRLSGRFHFDLKPSVDILRKQSAACFLKVAHFVDVLNHVAHRGCTMYRSAPVHPRCDHTKGIFRAEVWQCLAPHTYGKEER